MCGEDIVEKILTYRFLNVDIYLVKTVNKSRPFEIGFGLFKQWTGFECLRNVKHTFDDIDKAFSCFTNITKGENKNAGCGSKQRSRN